MRRVIIVQGCTRVGDGQLRNDVAVYAGRDDLNGVAAGVGRINVAGGVGGCSATRPGLTKPVASPSISQVERCHATPEQKTSIDPSSALPQNVEDLDRSSAQEGQAYRFAEGTPSIRISTTTAG